MVHVLLDGGKGVWNVFGVVRDGMGAEKAVRGPLSLYPARRFCVSTAATTIRPVSIRRVASGTALMLRIFSR